jgi:hypothetical protein
VTVHLFTAHPKKDQTGDGNDMSKTWIGEWKRIGGLEAMWRVRAGAEVPRRAADGACPSREPSGCRSRAAPWGHAGPGRPPGRWLLPLPHHARLGGGVRHSLSLSGPRPHPVPPQDVDVAVSSPSPHGQTSCGTTTEAFNVFRPVPGSRSS